MRFACTATKGDIGGVKEKDGIATESGEVTGTTSKGHGIFVETLASGDTGKGKCKAKGNADGSADFDCTGTYTMAK